MSTLTPTARRRRPPRTRRTQLHRLLRKHDHLTDSLTAHQCHALPTKDLWIALVELEDHIRDTYPRAYTTRLPAWLLRDPPGTHPIGGHHPACPLCTSHAPQRRAGKQEER